MALSFGAQLGLGVADKALGKVFGGKSVGLGKQLRKQRENDQVAYENRVKSLRGLGRQSGFNPLTLLGAGGLGTGGASFTIGNRQATGSLFTSAYERFQDGQIRATELEQENQRLELAARELTMRDRSRSIYSGRGVTPGRKDRGEDVHPEDDVYVPERSFGDNDPKFQSIFGVRVPFDLADRNTGAGGDVLGEAQTVVDVSGRAFDDAEARRLKKDGLRVYGMGGKYYAQRPDRKTYTYGRPQKRGTGANRSIGSVRW